MINRQLEHEVLVRRIAKYGQDAAEFRQLAKRLRALLPDRVSQGASRVRDEWDSEGHGKHRAAVALSVRRSLADSKYEKSVEEYVAMMHGALTARVQYETHSMLYWSRVAERRARARFPSS